MIYFDNAATTKPCKEAIKAQNHSNEQFFNPSALYLPALKIESEIGKVRQVILKKLGLTSSHNVVFTSGATEANNFALFQATRFKGKKILIGGGEHSSVYNYAKNCDSCTFETINLNKNGETDLEDLKAKLNSDVCLVSIMHVNNETGAINNISQAVKIVKNFSEKILFHCDAVQSFCKILQNLSSDIDFISISSHKIHGLKGTGALVYKNNANLKPFIKGGGQEFDLRSGTQNVGGIFAFGKATEHKTNFSKVEKLNTFARKILSEKINGIQFNGNGSPYILSVSISDVRSEVIVRMLQDKEIFVSNGSACSSKHADNRVLSGMGVLKKFIDGTIRLSFCEENTKEEIKIFADSLAEILKVLRNE